MPQHTYCLPDCPRRSSTCHKYCPDYVSVEKERLDKAKHNKGMADVDYIMGRVVRAKRFSSARKAENERKNRRG